jgi:predicted RNA-binding protein (virulence factor B family)
LIEIGKFNKLEICRQVDFGIYLTDGVDEILLPEKYIPENAEIGDKIDVFIYTDSEDRLIATTLNPKVSVNKFAYLKVSDINNVGVFMDWGLEKELFVPYKYSISDVKEGKSYVVKAVLDNFSGRVIGIINPKYFFRYESVELNIRDKVDLLVYQRNNLGYQVIVNEQYYGLIYENEIYDTIKIGQRLEGFVKKIRDDLKIDITLKSFGYDSAIEAMPKILFLLEQNKGFLPYNSKSNPEDIKNKFKMSKKVFKQAIGGLYKKRKILITDKGIELVK